MASVAAQPFSGTYRRPAGALELCVRRAPLRRLLVPRLAARRRGNAARRRRRSGARGIRARRLHLRGRATGDEGERARAGFLRRRAPSRDHVPLDGGSPRRRRPGRGRRRARDPGRTPPGHRQRSLLPHRDRPPSARVAGLQLRTSFDRREFGFDWQMELPGGGDAVGWDVEVAIDLLLKREDADAEG